MISRMPSVFTRKRTVNHAGLLFVPALYRESPFQTALHTMSRTNAHQYVVAKSISDCSSAGIFRASAFSAAVAVIDIGSITIAMVILLKLFVMLGLCI